METRTSRAELRAQAINVCLHSVAITLLVGLPALVSAKSPESLLDAVGTIYCDGKVRGSAVYISPRQEIADIAVDLALVVTAAHTLFDLQNGQSYKACEYRPQNKRLSGIAVRRVSKHGYPITDSDKIAQAESDIAFLVLSYPPRQSALHFGQQSQPISGPLALLGYRAELDDIALSAPCQPVDIDQPPNPALLFHNCQAGAGTSGAPIIDLSSGRIVAIHGGALVFDRHGRTQQSAAIQREQVDPSQWINQGRMIDTEIIELLKAFLESSPSDQ